MKTLQVNLQVQADIAAAQRNLQSLAKTLNEIGNKPLSVDSGPLKEAQEAAQQLQVHLQNAVNVNTGKLNLSALNSSLKQSGTSLNQLAMNLQNAGTKGQQAFMKLAQAVSSAEAPMMQMNSHLKNLGVTLLNTIKWQLASNLIHGIQGSMTEMVSHAKELNKALNDIQIVTGYSATKMANLADSARAAAKELNTTTVEYSKAALIFYQQGLTGDDVEERVNTVVKLAHVTGQSAETISSQMTAIWNNFDDGSHKLEYYADVITKLGAATASSSDEIANGLSKFASVADTVGLSYEKASAALATVVAETRQSEEVVGTAFKTIFARIQGLSLGETLEDGVDLNKYSKALEAIGVNVLDSNGKLKEMDVILNQLGEKWRLIGEAQQVAVAETVAGVRQYNQFLSLMNNYDTVLSNEDLAKQSTGTLEQQAEIWSKSWEAASKRVAETKAQLYDQILNDDSLIKLEDIFNGILKGIGRVIESAGGIMPVIGMIVGISSKVLFPIITNGLLRLSNHISILRGKAAKSMQETQNQFINMIKEMMTEENGWSETTRQQMELTLKLSQAKKELTIASKNMTEAQKAEAESQMAIYEAQISNIQASLERKAQLEEEIQKIKEKISLENGRQISEVAGIKSYKEKYGKDQFNEEIEHKATSRNLGYTNSQIETISSNKENKEKQYTENQDKIKNTSEEIKQDANNLDLLKQQRDAVIDKESQLKQGQLSKNMQKMNSAQLESEQAIHEAERMRLNEKIKKAEEYNKLVEDQKKLSKEINSDKTQLEQLEKVKKLQLEINQAKKDTNNAVVGTSEGFDSLASQGRSDQEAQLADSMRASIASSMGAVEGETGELKLDSSIANLEKLCETFVKYDGLMKKSSQELKNYEQTTNNTKKAEDKLAAAQDKLIKAKASSSKQSEKVRKATKEVEKATEELRKTLEKQSKAFDKLKQNFINLGKEAGLSEEQLEELENQLKNIKPEDTEGLKNVLKPFMESLNNAKGGVHELITNMISSLEQANIDPAFLKTIKEGLIELGYQGEETGLKIKNGLNPPKFDTSNLMVFSNGLSAIASGASKVAMAITALKSIGQIWSNEDADIVEKMSTILMSISMIIPVITGAMGALNTLTTAYNVLQEQGNNISLKSLVLGKKEIAQEGEKKVSKLALIAAKVLEKAIDTFGIAGVAIGLALGAAVIAGTIAQTAAIEKKNKAKEEELKKEQEAAKENAKNTSQSAEKWQEESNSIDTLIKKYKELRDAQKDVTQTQEDILAQSPKLVDSYKELNTSLKKIGIDLTDDIEALEQAISDKNISRIIQLKNKLDQQAASGSAAQIQKGAKASVDEIANKINKTSSGEGFSGSTLKLNVDGNDHDNTGEERKAAQHLISALTKAGINYTEKGDYTKSIDFSLDTSNTGNFLRQYEALVQARDDMLENMNAAERADSGIYEEISKILEDTKEQYDEMKTLVGDAEKYSIEDLASNVDLTNIASYADYEEKINKLKDEAIQKAEQNGEISEEERERIRATVDEWAKGKEVLTEYTKVASKLKDIEKNSGKDIKNEFAEYYKYLQKTDPDKAKLFLDVDFSRVKTRQALIKELDYLQVEANKKQLELNISTAKSAKEALEKGSKMTDDDWKTVNKSKKLIEDSGLNYDDFLKMNNKSQQTYYDKIIKEDTFQHLENAIKGIENIQKNSVAATELENAKNKVNQAQQRVEEDTQLRASKAATELREQLQLKVDTPINEIISATEKRISQLQKEIKINTGDAAKYGSGWNKNNVQITLSDNKTRDYDEVRKIAGEAYTGEEKHDKFVNEAKEKLWGVNSERYPTSQEIQRLQQNIEKIKNPSASADVQKELTNAIQEQNNAQEVLNNEIIELDKQRLDAIKDISSLLNESQNLAEFDETAERIKNMSQDSVEYFGAIASGLINLGEQYDSCSKEVLMFQQAMASGSAELQQETSEILHNSIAIAEQSKALGLTAESVEEQANELIAVNDLSEENYKVATKVAVLNQSMNKGLKELTDNWDTYKQTLKSAQKGTQEYAEASLKTKQALAEMLGVLNADYIPADFLELPGVMDLIDQAVQGNTSAINKLGVEMAKETVNLIKYKKEMKDINGEIIEAADFEGYKDKVLNGIQELSDGIENGTIKAGQNLTESIKGMGSEWIYSLNEMAAATGMSVEEMNSLLNELGVETNVTTKTKVVKTQVPIYETTQQVTDGDYTKGNYTTRTSTRIIDYEEMDGAIEVAQINTGEESGTPPTIKYAGRDNPSSSALTKSDSKKNSSSSSSPTTKSASHDHEVNRYSNEENAIKGLSESYERLNKAKDQAFGAGRIHMIEQELKALKELKQASGDYLDAIAGKGNASKIAEATYTGKNIGSMISSGQLGGTIKADYNSLYGGLSASGKRLEYTAKDSAGNEWLASDNYSLSGFNSLFGTNLQFSLDSFGNIQNKDSILNLLQNLKNNENDAYSRVADPSAGSITEYNKRIAYLDEIKERIEQYGSTAELLTEKTDEYLDYISQLQEKNAELITEKMNNGVNLGQKTIQRLERSIKILGDSIYKTAEAMQGWFDSTFKEGVQADKQQGDSAIQAIEETNQKVKLYEQNPLDENAISPAEAAEILSSAEDTLDSVVDSLLQRVQDGKEYYGNVLDYWNDKLEAVNRSIENNIQVFDHLQNILGLLGRSTDYEAIGDILQGKFEASQEDYLSKKTQANIAKQAYEQAKQNRENLIAEGISAEDLEIYDENVLQKALDDYQTKADAMYTSLEETIELSNQLFENEMNKIMQESEDRLTGEWGNFSDLDSAMKRQQSISDEYLTKTNQIYETNSLLRKLSQDIDKNDSLIAKNKLKAFSDEITAMQTQEKLSKTDLEIAKARYEVLKAQIALEEAQNAKSTVRLQRDNEGNYGYVYTADQEKTADAEQNLADKQNDLYNLLLTQAETYGQKSIEMRKEWQAEMQALVEQYQNDTSMSEEEFLMKQADINNKYREMEIAYLESFQTANTWLNQVGAEGQTEAWINSFDTVITQHRIFNDDSINELNGYNNEINSVADDVTNTINDKFSELKEQRDFFTEESKTGNEELQDSIDEVTSSVSQLSKSVTGKNGLADSMSNAMNKAQNLTTAFINQYDALQSLITKYSSAADEANKLYNRTADLVNVQVALNHANRGATSVSWGSGASSVYSSGGNGGNGDNGAGSNNTPSGIRNEKDSGTKYPHKYLEKTPFTYHWDGTSWNAYVNYRTKQYEGGPLGKVETAFIGSVEDPYEQYARRTKIFKQWLASGTVSGKTGMYTGSWDGPDIEENGKLAFLHQKELVLNADDTENMLSAVKLIRQISQTIDLQAAAYNAAASGLSIGQLANSNQTLQQEVTIHAEFPNVSDHNEIEEAFNNLVNRASQYANRN